MDLTHVFLLGLNAHLLLSKQKVEIGGASTIYIQDISLDEAHNLRETLRKIGSVKNYLPLLNKVQTRTSSSYMCCTCI